jgi:hypothetical protein
MNNILVICVLAKMIAQRKGEIKTEDSWGNKLIFKKWKMHISYTVICASLRVTAYSLVKILHWQYILKSPSSPIGWKYMPTNCRKLTNQREILSGIR